MAGITMPKTLKGFNILVDGIGYAGRCSKLKLPELSVKGEEHRGAGMDFARKLDMGMEPMECTFTMTEFSDEIRKLVGKLNGSNTQLTFYGTLNDDESPESTPVEAKIRCAIHKEAPTEWESGNKTEDEYTCDCKFYQLLVGGEEVYYVDNDNFIRRIGGEDQLQNMRSDLKL
jgi:hypothetical protein